MSKVNACRVKRSCRRGSTRTHKAPSRAAVGCAAGPSCVVAWLGLGAGGDVGGGKARQIGGGLGESSSAAGTTPPPAKPLDREEPPKERLAHLTTAFPHAKPSICDQPSKRTKKNRNGERGTPSKARLSSLCCWRRQPPLLLCVVLGWEEGKK